VRPLVNKSQEQCEQAEGFFHRRRATKHIPKNLEVGEGTSRSDAKKKNKLGALNTRRDWIAEMKGQKR
jgi:hypothetical protein